MAIDIIRKAWCGVLSSDSLLSKIQEHDSNNNDNTIGIFIVCGSWNRGMLDCDPQIICNLLDNVVDSGKQQVVVTISGLLQVDINDDGDFESTTCIFGDDGCTLDVFPCPPSKLPALLFVGKRRNMPQPQIRYINSFISDDIYNYCMTSRRGYEGRGSVIPELPTLTSSMTYTVIDTVRKEINDQILYLGMAKKNTTTNNPTSTSVGQQQPSSEIHNSNNPSSSKAIRIFVAGDRMSVGKTSVCLGLIGSLIQSGDYPPDTLAYIKPATQNEAPQLVQKYCEKMGIDCVPIGPVVYYRGFTRAFLAGTTESSTQLLSKVGETVDKLATNKKVVIIDGVGFPAVGSICGTDNASVARASGYPPSMDNSSNSRIAPGVLLVGGSGVGGAVDAFNLNATYFEKAGVPVLGAIFNKLSLDGFYSLENCKEQITTYFNQNEHQQQLQRRPFGFVPMFDGLGSGTSLEAANEYIHIFSRHVNMDAILKSATEVQSQSFPLPMMITTTTTTTEGKPPPSKRQKVTTTSNSNNTPIARSREEIEQAAIQAGAAPSA